MKKDKCLFFMLFLIIFFIIFLSFNYNFLDSDSGREINSAMIFNQEGYLGGPLITPILYRILMDINPFNTLVQLKIFNAFLFILLIFISFKLIKKYTNEKFALVGLFFLISISSLSILIFYFKPYLLTLLFISMSVWFLSKQDKSKNLNFLILGTLFLSVAIITKNHAYPLIILPFLLVLESNKKSFIRKLFLIGGTIFVMVFPFILINILKFGFDSFWHYPNTWFYSEGFNYYIANNFWGFPATKYTTEYYLNQWNFLKKTIPLISLLFLFPILLKNFKRVKIPLVAGCLCFLPYIFSVMPSYSIYNYLLVYFLSILLVTFLFYLTSPKRKFIIFAFFVLIIFSSISISENFIKFSETNNNYIPMIQEVKEMKFKVNEEFVRVYARDYRLQPQILYWDFSIFDDTDKETLLFILDKDKTDYSNKLIEEKIVYLVFYKDYTFNEKFYNILLSPLNKSFDMIKYRESPHVEKIYDGNYLEIFKIKT